jgi:3-oxoacyl-[acyl-carrier-protein] synthase III
MAVEAVKGLLRRSAGIGPEEIDLMIVATVTADMQFPATANIICDAIGARKNAWGFDVNGRLQRASCTPWSPAASSSKAASTRKWWWWAATR